MRWSRYFLPTLREVPAEAEVISHQLMVRAGMIRKLAAGVYSYLPFGLRALKKVREIIREEMNRKGALEVYLPVVQPAEIWQESGRWQLYGKELLRFKDRHDRDFCLGPTHEEVITDIVRKEVKSYRQLPLNLYQIQTKFRDEVRPRFGLMRGREFEMKDAYSFDKDEEGANKSYQDMYDAYCRIFERCDLNFRAVEADTGPIGGSYSHEFMVLADTGEDIVVGCDTCSYAANMEKAEVRRESRETQGVEMKELEKIYTPQVKTIQDLTTFLSAKPDQMVKTLIFQVDGRPVAVLVRGDHEINPVKLKNLLGADVVEMADEETVRRVSGAPIGFAGPVGLKGIEIIADFAVQGMSNFITGANEADRHLKNVNLNRDFKVDRFADIRQAMEGDLCPRCETGRLKITRGIEVGHVFKLGTKYSKAMGATFLDADGKEKYIIMGCYGIGVGRTVAAAIEQNHDENGIIWPFPIAPFHVLILPVNMTDSRMVETAEKIYQELLAEGIEVLLDDRDERPGAKFKDADLIGIPLRVTVGNLVASEGKVEIKFRKTGEVEKVPVTEVTQRIKAILSAQLK
ncbi:MAG TPA: proline--tRNA ligase [Candidatus Limnocylindrales bacterium]|nr:proline--tRNA ligase [Candidatus Limnocylindrales bacterium]